MRPTAWPPVGTFSLWLGYTLAGMLRGLLAGLVVLGMVLLLVPSLHLSWGFFGSMVLASFCFGSLGVLIGLLLRSFDDQALASEFFLVPMTFLSGTLIPVERLPGLLQKLVWLFPLTPAAQLLRATLAGAGFPWESAVLVVAWTLFFFFAGWLRLCNSDA